MNDPYSSPRSGYFFVPKRPSSWLVLTESLSLALFFVLVLKLVSYEVLPDQVEVTDVPPQLRPTLLLAGVYAMPLWRRGRRFHRCALRLTLSAVTSVAAGLLFAFCLELPLAEVLYWAFFLEIVLTLFALSLSALLFIRTSKPTERCGET